MSLWVYNISVAWLLFQSLCRIYSVGLSVSQQLVSKVESRKDYFDFIKNHLKPEIA